MDNSSRSPVSPGHHSSLSDSELSERKSPGFQIEEEDDCFEGVQQLLPDARMGELALECWNLRKTVLDLNAHALKHQKEMKTQKNLLKNLQRLVHDVQEENKTRTRETLALKVKCTELEKKLAEANSSNAMLNNNISRSKKAMSSTQARVLALEKEKKALESSTEERLARLSAEHQATESLLRSNLSNTQTEMHRVTTENQTLKVMLNESTRKSQELMEHALGLEEQVASLTTKCENVSEFLNRELELAYEQLHSKMEKIWNERVAAGKELWLKEHENNQLMAFILSEGLQLPNFPPPTTAPPIIALLDAL